MFSVKNGNRFMLIFLSANLIVQIILVIACTLLFGEKFAGSPNMSVLLYLFAFALPVVAYFTLTGHKPIKSLRVVLLNPVNIILTLLISLAVYPIMSVINILSSLLTINDPVGNMLDSYSKYPFALFLFAVAFLPAVFEELLFRGIILRNYKNVPIKRAALINGLFFGIMHLNVQQFFYTFMLGYIFTYLVFITGSIIAPMLAHFTINAISVSLSYYFANSADASDAADSVLSVGDTLLTAASAMPLVIIAAVVLVALFKLLGNFNKNLKTRSQMTGEEETNGRDTAASVSSEKTTTHSFYIVILLYISIIALNYIFLLIL